MCPAEKTNKLSFNQTLQSTSGGPACWSLRIPETNVCRLTTELCHAVKLKRNMNSTEIKACPFCGGTAEARPREDYYDFRVFCKDDKCGCSSPAKGHTFEQAQEWWNRRAGDRQPVVPETGSAKGVGISDLLIRARQPKQGDTYHAGDLSCVVKSIDDGQVWYDMQRDDQEPSHHSATIEEFARLAEKTIRNGAIFKEAHNAV
jgi:hypothetical protein